MNIIFDLDDTLADCAVFYNKQIERFCEYQSNRTGVNSDIIKKLREHIDVTFTVTPDGFSRVRFPRSCAATSVAVDIMMGNSIDEVSAYQSFELGDEVFNAMYPLFNGVPDMLDSLKKENHQLFLHTKGDFSVQTRKIELNNIRRWFMNDKIYIVNQKTPDTIRRIIDDHSLEPQNTIVVGDSLRDDIGNAATLGITSVWVSGKHAADWSYEISKDSVSIHFEIENVTELPSLIQDKLTPIKR